VSIGTVTKAVNGSITFSNPTSSSVTVNWSVPNGTVPSAMWYKVVRARTPEDLDQNNANVITVQNWTTGFAPPHVDATDLDPNTVYFFKVSQSFSSTGSSPMSYKAAPFMTANTGGGGGGGGGGGVADSPPEVHSNASVAYASQTKLTFNTGSSFDAATPQNALLYQWVRTNSPVTTLTEFQGATDVLRSWQTLSNWTFDVMTLPTANIYGYWYYTLGVKDGAGNITLHLSLRAAFIAPENGLSAAQGWAENASNPSLIPPFSLKLSNGNTASTFKIAYSAGTTPNNSSLTAETIETVSMPASQTSFSSRTPSTPAGLTLMEGGVYYFKIRVLAMNDAEITSLYLPFLAEKPHVFYEFNGNALNSGPSQYWQGRNSSTFAPTETLSFSAQGSTPNATEAAIFNGTSTALTVPNLTLATLAGDAGSSTSLQGITIGGWVKFASIPTGITSLFGFPGAFEIYHSNGIGGFIGATNSTLNPGTTLTGLAGSWHHIAMTSFANHDGMNGNAQIFIDGKPYTSVSLNSTNLIPTNYSGFLKIGKGVTPADYYFNGSMDNVFVTQRSLSPLAMEQLATAELRCPVGQVLVGVEVKYGAWVDKVTAICQPMSAGALSGSAANYGSLGGTGGSASTYTCPAGQVIDRIYYENQSAAPFALNAFKVGCKNISDNSQAGQSAQFGSSGSATPQTLSCPGTRFAIGLLMQAAWDSAASYAGAIRGILCTP
jgi:hypothetical protein